MGATEYKKEGEQDIVKYFWKGEATSVSWNRVGQNETKYKKGSFFKLKIITLPSYVVNSLGEQIVRNL